MTRLTQREDALLGAAALLIPTGATDSDVELTLVQGCAQRHRLHDPGELLGAVAERRHALITRLLVRRQAQVEPELFGGPVAQFVHGTELPARVDVHHRERDGTGVEGLARKVQQDGRVLADAVQQHRPFECGGGLPEDPDGFSLKGVEHPGGLVVD